MNDPLRFQRFQTAYRSLALIVLNTLLLMLVGGVIAHWVLKGVYSVWDRHLKNTNPVSAKYGKALNEAYPGWSVSDLNELLRENWDRPLRYEPFTQFKEREIDGKFVHVGAEGFRRLPAQPWPPHTDAFNIFIFGGSTTFGKGLPDHETIPAYLQHQFPPQINSKPVQVYNLGRGGYYSSQERALFEKLVVSGIVPHVAIFIDGLNEFSHINDEPAYTSQLRLLMDAPPNRTARVLIGQWLEQLPFGRLVGSFQKGFVSYLLSRQTKKTSMRPALTPEEIQRVVDRYLINKRLIESAAVAIGVKTLFIWQPIPFYKYDVRLYPFEPWVTDRTAGDGYTQARKRLASKPALKNFLWLADCQERTKDLLYLDQVHYRAIFCEKLAEMIAKHLHGKLN